MGVVSAIVFFLRAVLGALPRSKTPSALSRKELRVSRSSE